MENEAQVMSNALKKPKQLIQTTSMLFLLLAPGFVEVIGWRWFFFGD